MTVLTLVKHGRPTHDTAGWGLGPADSILVNNHNQTDLVSVTVHHYLMALSEALPLIYTSERALADLMDGRIDLVRAGQDGRETDFLTAEQDNALFASLTNLAAQLLLIRRRLSRLAVRVASDTLPHQNDSSAISLSRSIRWAANAITDLITDLTARQPLVDDIRQELATVCRIRVRTAQCFRSMSALLSQAMDNGIDYEVELNAPSYDVESD